MSPFPSPIASLAARVRDELSALIDPSKPVTVRFEPQKIDVIGGLLQGHGGSRCTVSIDRYACALVQPRTDGQILIFDFNEYDQHRPFTLQISASALQAATVDALMRNLAEPGRAFAAGALAALHKALAGEQGGRLLEGVNVVLSRDKDVDAKEATGRVVLKALKKAIASADEPPPQPTDETGRYLELVQSAATAPPGQEPLATRVDLPTGIHVVGIPLSQTEFARPDIDIAARMAHWLVLEKMRAFGKQAGRELISDPTNGQIGNLALDDYKRFFRGTLPETMRGATFLEQFGHLVPSPPFTIDPQADYAPQLVADHLVIEAHRVREFVRYLGEALTQNIPLQRKLALDKAGHLLYASHKSARDNCALCSEEADRIVDAVRAGESSGLFGARLGVCGSSGAVVALCRDDSDASTALDHILRVPHAVPDQELVRQSGHAETKTVLLTALTQ